MLVELKVSFQVGSKNQARTWLINNNKRCDFVILERKEVSSKVFLDPGKRVIGEKAISLLDHFQLNCKIRQITFF